MLQPLWAAIAGLGLWALGKVWDARYGLVNLWLWGGIMGAALTHMSVQRLVGGVACTGSTQPFCSHCRCSGRRLLIGMHRLVSCVAVLLLTLEPDFIESILCITHPLFSLSVTGKKSAGVAISSPAMPLAAKRVLP